MQVASDIQQSLNWLEQVNQWLRTLADQYGYLGVFVVSLVGASSVILPLPYTIIIFSIGASQTLNPFLVAIAGGAGSAVGEFFGYLLGYYGRAVVSEERKRKMNYFLRVFNRYGAITIFLFALLPLPDDLLFIPLGIMRYSFTRAFVPTFIGKMLMCLILSYGGYLSVDIIRSLLGGDGGALTIVVSTVLLIIIIVAMLKIDWEKIFPLEEKTSEKDRAR